MALQTRFVLVFVTQTFRTSEFFLFVIWPIMLREQVQADIFGVAFRTPKIFLWSFPEYTNKFTTVPNDWEISYKKHHARSSRAFAITTIFKLRSKWKNQKTHYPKSTPRNRMPMPVFSRTGIFAAFWLAKNILLCKNDFFGQKNFFFVQKWFFRPKNIFYAKKTFSAKFFQSNIL